MDHRVERIINQIMEFEAYKYTSDHTHTYRGIVWEYHHKKLIEKYGIHSYEQLCNTPDPVLREFYYEEFIKPSRCEEFLNCSIDLAFQVADFAFNAGISTAIKGIQKYYNICACVESEMDGSYVQIYEDGKFGSQTAKAIDEINGHYFYLNRYKSEYTKKLDKLYRRIRQAHYFKLLDKKRDSGQYTDKHLMNCLESWNRRCMFEF